MAYVEGEWAPSITEWSSAVRRACAAAMVFVADGDARLVVRRETLDDLIRLER